MKLNQFIQSGDKLLRCGFTTGSCATLASKACAIMLFTKQEISSVSIVTPKGITVVAEVLDITIIENSVTCAVKKDAGDDIDVTDGMLVYSRVSLSASEVAITGGVGVGKVTKSGLNQPVGEYAINSTPRKTIAEELTSLASEYDYTGGFDVCIFTPTGEEIAKRTFNANLGIIGGISIIGTSGIVEPMSMQALLDTIKLEIGMLNTSKHTRMIITFGNYGEDFIGRNNFDVLSNIEQVKISNFVGDSLDCIYHTDIEEVMLVGHIGKIVKLAGGIMNTHSKFGDCRVELFGFYAALNGASQEVIEQLKNSATTDACIEILDKISLREKVLQDILVSCTSYIQKRVNNKIKVGIITFSNVYGLLGISTLAEELLSKWKGALYNE